MCCMNNKDFDNSRDSFNEHFYRILATKKTAMKARAKNLLLVTKPLPDSIIFFNLVIFFIFHGIIENYFGAYLMITVYECIREPRSENFIEVKCNYYIHTCL
jgi:hypothetical protein